MYGHPFVIWPYPLTPNSWRTDSVHWSDSYQIKKRHVAKKIVLVVDRRVKGGNGSGAKKGLRVPSVGAADTAPTQADEARWRQQQG